MGEKIGGIIVLTRWHLANNSKVALFHIFQIGEEEIIHWILIRMQISSKI